MQQTYTKGLQDLAWLVEEGELLRIVQKVKIRPYYQMVCAHTRILSWEWDA